MIQQDMTASMRQDFGKGASHRLRKSGFTPAILYGGKKDSVALSLDEKALTRALINLHGQNVVVNLHIEGEKGKKTHHVLIKDVQKDPVTDTLVHVDFFEIPLDQEITLEVQVKYTGKAKGVDMGGWGRLCHAKGLDDNRPCFFLKPPYHLQGKGGAPGHTGFDGA